jgi:hypothetical protein
VLSVNVGLSGNNDRERGGVSVVVHFADADGSGNRQESSPAAREA